MFLVHRIPWMIHPGKFLLSVSLKKKIKPPSLTTIKMCYMMFRYACFEKEHIIFFLISGFLEPNANLLSLPFPFLPLFI